MLWRRRSEGFDWHKYVRTTIKLRRRDRRQRVARARQAVVGGLKEAGQIAAEGLKDAGHIAAAGLKDAGRAGVVAGASGLAAARRWSLAGLRATAAVLVWVVDKVSRAAAFILSSFLIPAGRWMQARLAPLSATIHRLGYAEPLLVLAVALLAIGLAHAHAEGLDDKGVAVTGLGLVLLAFGSLPFTVGRKPWPGARPLRGALAWLDGRLPWLKRVPRPSFKVVAGTLVATASAWAGWSLLSQSKDLSLASLPGLGGESITGRAVALTGDTLRLNGRTIRLYGIEAPEIDQECGSERRRSWRCGASARTSLQALVRGRTLRCAASGSDRSGRMLASCYLGDMDVAAELVRRGHVFAQPGLFSTYARLELQARNAKLGLWRANVERPSDYRARRWEAAKRSAPDGCPIKGYITAEGRIYVLPWSPDYARVRVRERRGDRWFCSEDEARQAGWRPIERS